MTNRRRLAIGLSLALLSVTTMAITAKSIRWAPDESQPIEHDGIAYNNPSVIFMPRISVPSLSLDANGHVHIEAVSDLLNTHTVSHLASQVTVWDLGAKGMPIVYEDRGTAFELAPKNHRGGRLSTTLQLPPGTYAILAGIYDLKADTLIAGESADITVP